MAESKHRKKFKAKKKVYNTQKNKQKQMANEQEAKAQENPVTFTYDEQAQTVSIPRKAWETLNHCAMKLQEIALFVSTMELIGQQHISDGTLIPVFNNDLEFTGVILQDGTQQKRIKQEFWTKRAQRRHPFMEKPTIVMADGNTIYDSTKQEESPQVEVGSL